jgi:hypothetical protein
MAEPDTAGAAPGNTSFLQCTAVYTYLTTPIT